MTQVTVKELAQVVDTPVERLLQQMCEAGLPHTSAEQVVTDNEKQALLAHLKSSHGANKAEQPRKITLQRKTTSTLRVAGSKSISVEVRKKKVFVERSAEEIAAEPEKEKTAEPVKKSPAKSVKKITAKPVKESPAKSVEKITAKPAEENSARSVKNISAEPEIHEEFKNARRINTPEKKPEPIKAETPVENFEVTSDRMSEIDRLLKELEDKK